MLEEPDLQRNQRSSDNHDELASALSKVTLEDPQGEDHAKSENGVDGLGSSLLAALHDDVAGQLFCSLLRPFLPSPRNRP